MTETRASRRRACLSGGFVGPLALAAALLASPASVPPQVTMVSRVREYVREYQRASVSLLADETTTQTVERDGRVVRTRQTTGELFSTFVAESGAWMAVHDVATVDGISIAQPRDLAAALRNDPSLAVAREIANTNARYNIGPVARNFNEPMLAIQLLGPSRTRDVIVDRERFTPGATPGRVVTFRVRVRDTATFVGSMNGRRVRVEGTVTAQAETGTVVHTTLTLDAGGVSAVLDTTYARDERLELWVPTTFVEIYRADRAPEITTVRSSYANYRRFEATGRVVN